MLCNALEAASVGDVRLLIVLRNPVPALSASQLCYRSGSLSTTSICFHIVQTIF